MEAGRNGAKLDELFSYADEEGIPREAVQSALEKLEKSEEDRKGGKRVLHDGIRSKRAYGKDVREIEVEKIFPGSAVVLIDGKWRARLEPAEFNGPRNMMKKGSRFLALVDIYRLEGVLRVGKGSCPEALTAPHYHTGKTSPINK